MFNIFNLFTKNESPEWEPSRKVPLQLNLRTESLNDIRIGDPVEKLRFFGRPDNGQPSELAIFEYRGLGLEVEVQNEDILNFVFMINPPTETVTKHFIYTRSEERPSRFAHCELTLIAADGGSRLNISRSTSLGEVERFLGVAPEKSFDEDEGYCEDSTYRQGNLTLYFTWLEDGTIEDIIVEP